ncbi:MAG: aminotransferase class IV, partial [Saprospiraceae bacterium]
MINLNGQQLENLSEHLALLQRGLYYGDSLFESIRVFGGRMPLWEQHWMRLTGGLQAMGYKVPAHWTGQYFKEQ